VSLQNEPSGAVLTLRLNRPDRLNAINEATAQQLVAALRQAELSPDVRVIVLRGNGRAFCAGRDVSEPPTPEILDLVQRVSTAMVRCSKPVVCAVHGWVVGAGVEWMLDADIVIAARSARFKLPEAEIGVFVTGGIVATLPAMAGMARAKGVLLLGEEFSATDAERWGLIWKVVDDDALDAEVARVAQRLAALSPDIVYRFKRVLNEVGLNAFDKGIALETQMQTELQSAAPSTKAP
jgi:2-(1,2-epoxy-1,2-dihydrophenyl)acetyl-CoA isomerase